ncbi:MAG: AbrB/MazE/SpoVT family DNA-binding domain-containing protein [Eubacterium limosum]|nr:AbrB/MazE/SpoVT family DNA-binding domain-containing protein [Eubacterium limosum]
MTMHKKVNSKGGLTIPRETRAELGLFPGQAMDLEIEGNAIVLKKHTKTCRFCGSPEDVRTAMGIDFCRSCGLELMAAISESGA